MENLYESDFYSWTKQQKQLLIERKFDQLDLDNLIEEVESMGKGEMKSLRSHLTHLLSHCLKWQYQPEQRSSGWQGTIREQRKKAKLVLADNPGMKHTLDDIYRRAYDYALIEVVKDTGMDEDEFPAECPWSYELIMKQNWLP